MENSYITGVIKECDFYSRWMASEGQTSTHEPQSTHSSLFTFAFSLFIAIACAGHSSTQVSQAVHRSSSTIAVMVQSRFSTYVSQKYK
jgi:hypothetical protein